jgi:hypothetical protein
VRAADTALMSTKAVDHMKTAVHAQKQDSAALKSDQTKLAGDKKTLVSEHDRVEHDSKTVQKQNDVLAKVRHEELGPLHPLQKQRDALRTRFQSTNDPAVKNALDEKQANIDDIRARFDPQRLGDRAKLERDIASKQKVRTALGAQKNVVAKDEKTVSGEQAKVGKDMRQVAAMRPNSVGGTVGQWISRAQSVLHKNGVPLSKMNAKDIALIISHESGGDPKAVNNWDSNAAAGTPSEGLMQTIGPTFDSYKLKGHGHILNPVDNIIAGVRYAIDRYGSISDVPGVVAVKNGGSYVGY